MIAKPQQVKVSHLIVLTATANRLSSRGLVYYYSVRPAMGTVSGR
jgi:hypothetical protein